MKSIAIYGELIKDEHKPFVKIFFDALEKVGLEFIIHENYLKLISSFHQFDKKPTTFKRSKDLTKYKVECMISIGGDGSMLNSFQFLFKTNIKVFGINTGRLGFLSNVSTEQVEWALKELVNDNYKIKERSVLEIKIEGIEKTYYAVNEVTVHKRDTSSMLTIRAKVDDYFVNAYWADGVIVSTPTGSTAYSLSCGGPILMPGSKNLLITPIAPHNLTVRPIVFSDEKAITLEVESRSGNYLLAMDSGSKSLSSKQKVFVKKADFYIHLLKFSDYDYFNTLRSKLMWGADSRN